MYPILVSFLFLFSFPVSSQTYHAKVIKIVDGDTYDVIDSVNKVSRIRMNGIDAPEKGQAFGQKAKEELGRWCFSKNIFVKVYGKDRNGRLIADGYIDGRSLSLVMIQQGFAWHFLKYSSDTTLADAEKKARAARIGLWADVKPIAPWEYRALKRKKV